MSGASFSMGLDLNNDGRINQVMSGPLGVDIDNDGTVDVVITPEQLRTMVVEQRLAQGASGTSSDVAVAATAPTPTFASVQQLARSFRDPTSPGGLPEAPSLKPDDSASSLQPRGRWMWSPGPPPAPPPTPPRGYDGGGTVMVTHSMAPLAAAAPMQPVPSSMVSVPAQSQPALRSPDSWVLQGAPQPIPSNLVSVAAHSQPALRSSDSWLVQGPLPSDMVLVPARNQPALQPEPDSWVLQGAPVPGIGSAWAMRQPPLPPTPPATQQWVSPQVIEKPYPVFVASPPVEKIIEKPYAVPVDRIVEKPYAVPVDRIVEKPYTVNRIVDRPVYVDRGAHTVHTVQVHPAKHDREFPYHDPLPERGCGFVGHFLPATSENLWLGWAGW
mmetsp:Transcript_93277/g.200195  ORF Transcript_93277/g.200195 Transcript_93277/m.200195 type:complete len:385 (-) Transcript_93277:98-1252(-)